MYNISVIIPIYNSDKYLEKCVRSIESQRKDIQIILIDDGSKDDSWNICKKLNLKFPNIVLLRQNNQGPGFARNNALKEAKGKYIYFVDSDDYVESNEITRMYNYAEKEKMDAVIGGYKRVNEEGKTVYKKIYKNKVYLGNQVKQVLLPKIIGSSPKGHDNIRVTIWNVLFKKEIITQHHIFFEKVKAEDTIFNIDFYNYAKKVAIINSDGYCYRKNKSSLTSSTYKRNLFQQSKHSYLIQKNKLIDIDIFDKAKYRLSRQFFVDTRESLRQELTNVSGKKRKDALKAMKEIMSDSLLNKLIKEYPIEQIGFKQKLFLKLIEFDDERIMYFFIRLYVINNMG